MDNLFLTLIIAFVVIVIAIACMAAGWLISGKIKIDRCGRDPSKPKDTSCSSAPCDLCRTPPKSEGSSKENDDLSKK